MINEQFNECTLPKAKTQRLSKGMENRDQENMYGDEKTWQRPLTRAEELKSGDKD